MAEDWFNALADEAANGVSATDAVGAVLGGPAGAVALGASVAARAAAGGGGSWSFDKDEIDAVIAEWKALAEDLQADRTEFHSAATVNAPSNDQPSTRFMVDLVDGLAALENSNRSMWRYVDEFIGKLEEAKRAVGQVDDENSETFKG
ncbi:hypothetical protein [Saccharomonospora cyanea]|uniref:PE domain-containing protein n=1 Tax=Saccharomonospora cyanea NA-134 TaxID=882082 RepID=H5XJC2_9PSEU|nr:hypothetical protein [Saccharomonospora cyanea]EHR62932.1 hypothetical protein SaccyDRAFT_4111 [Saccharomonospora cyanea NA-134]